MLILKNSIMSQSYTLARSPSVQFLDAKWEETQTEGISRPSSEKKSIETEETVEHNNRYSAERGLKLFI